MEICYIEDSENLLKRIHVLNVLLGFEEDEKVTKSLNILQTRWKLVFNYKKERKIKAVTKLQAWCRGYILRMDKNSCEKAIDLMQKKVRSFLMTQKNKREQSLEYNAAKCIQNNYKLYKKHVLIDGRTLREIMSKYSDVRQKNLYLSNIILKMMNFNESMTKLESINKNHSFLLQ